MSKKRNPLLESLGEKEFGNYFQVSQYLARQPEVFEQISEQLAYSLLEALRRSGMQPVKDSLRMFAHEPDGILGSAASVGAKLRAEYSKDPLTFVIFLTHRMLEAERKIDGARADAEFWKKESRDLKNVVASCRTMRQLRAKLKAIEDAKLSAEEYA